MRQWARFISVLTLFALSTLCQAQTVSMIAQQPAPASRPAKQSSAVRQAAMNLIEEALAGTGALTVPSNRLAIELRAFPTLYSRSAARARALVQQMAGEFAQAANTGKQDPDQNPQSLLNTLRSQRNGIARVISASDPDLALLFVSLTQPSLDDDPEDHALITDLAAQIALHDPHRALQLAEQQLKESADLPQSMTNLLNEVERDDAQAGARLFHDIVDHLKQQNLADDSEALSFAAVLLGNQFSRQTETGSPDSALQALAEAVVAAASNPALAQDQPYVLNGVLSNASDALKALVPSRASALMPPAVTGPRVVFQNSFWQKLNQARADGDGNQTLTLLAHAPDDLQPRVVQQTAYMFAANGDLETTRRLADKLEPWQRNNVMQQAIRSAALAAASHADFATARQLTAQITDEDSRATLLSEIAIFANGNGKSHLAEDLLGEAVSLVSGHSAGTAAFSAQLRIAQAYLRIKPAQAIPLLDRSAGQIDQALSAAAQLDGFLPDSHSFSGSELILGQGFLYSSLLEPYAQAAAELATLDLPAARVLAGRLPLPEARLMAEIVVAAGVLDQQDQSQALHATAAMDPAFAVVH